MAVAKYESAFTGAQVDDAVTKRHTQNTDTILDEGGANEVSAADIKDAVTKRHTQNTDTALDTGGDNEVAAADIKAVVDADRTVLVSALTGYHSTALSATGTDIITLSRLFTLEENSRYLIDIFGQVQFEGTEPVLTTNASGISEGILYRADSAGLSYASFTGFLTLNVAAETLEAVHLVGEFVTGTSPSFRMQYSRSGNPGEDALIRHFTVKLTKVEAADQVGI